MVPTPPLAMVWLFNTICPTKLCNCSWLRPLLFAKVFSVALRFETKSLFSFAILLPESKKKTPSS